MFRFVKIREFSHRFSNYKITVTQLMPSINSDKLAYLFVVASIMKCVVINCKVYTLNFTIRTGNNRSCWDLKPAIADVVLPLLKLLSWIRNFTYEAAELFHGEKDLSDKSCCMNTKLFQKRRFGVIKILSFVQFMVDILHQSRYSFVSVHYYPCATLLCIYF